VFAEALAAGRPVIGTSVGGISDVVVDGRTGVLVEPASPSALADAINDLLSQPQRARKMGQLGQRWVRRRFDWRRVGEQYAQLLLQAAGASGRGKQA
jgi:glycosyltransferase involved in cell wall biosynthesis